MHVQLDSESRRKKEVPKKSISISTLSDLKKAIVSRSLENVLQDAEIEPIPISTLVELGNSFCDIATMELNNTTLSPKDEE